MAEVLATADLVDLHGEAIQSCDLQLKQYGGLRLFTGPVRTVRCLDDNALVKGLLTTDGAGAILVIDGGGSVHSALLGDHMAVRAPENAWGGFVINGAVRDVAQLRQMPLGIKAIGSNPRRSRKSGGGEVDVPLSFGGCTFAPGSTLTADDDGIVVYG